MSNICVQCFRKFLVVNYTHALKQRSRRTKLKTDTYQYYHVSPIYIRKMIHFNTLFNFVSKQEEWFDFLCLSLPSSLIYLIAVDLNHRSSKTTKNEQKFKKRYFIYLYITIYFIADDHSRVVLGTMNEDAGYINANYIKVRIAWKANTWCLFVEL